MRNLKTISRQLLKFFPLQLVFLQLKKNHFIMALWFIFFALATQNLGHKFGLPYLLLSPEYMGEVDWISFFILGFSMGGFFMAYHLYSYIIIGPSFPFLVTFSRPFFKFCINNSTFPIFFYSILCFNIYDVQVNEELDTVFHAVLDIVGLTIGTITFILISVFYFFRTNLDVFKLKKREKRKKQRNLYSLVGSLFTKQKYWFQAQPTITYQPSYYFTSLFKIVPARAAEHYDRKIIRDIFRQNHLNASVFEVMIIGSFFLIGLLQDFTVLMIPSGASFFLLSTMLVMVVTIFYSWFKGWAISIIFLVFVGFNYISTRTGFLQSRNQAYGLSYNTKVAYNLSTLKKLQYSQEQVQNDLNHHVSILENWKQKASEAQHTKRPKLIIVNCSGGGLRSAMWTHFAMQQVNKKTKGVFFKSTHLITGASGGMIGAAYFRDIHRTTTPKERAANAEQYLENISKDMLNSVAFNLAAHDIFLRYRKQEVNGETYLKDRGFSFEEQLNKNTNSIMDNRLADYVAPEFNSTIPLMIFSPTIINDGRRMIIGSQPYGFLNGVSYEEKGVGPENIEFIKLFSTNKVMETKYTSVLRMNSTFPYILPMVSMPTQPEIHLMDAGIRDNYGTKTTVRYIVALQDWLRENTSGVIIVEMRDINKDYDMSGDGNFSLLDRIVKPGSNFYGNFQHAQEYNAEELIENNLCRNLKIDVVTFTLRKDPTAKIALSWHLTNREKKEIKKTFKNKNNQKELQKLIDLLKH